MNLFFYSLLSFAILTSCSSGLRKQQDKIIGHLQQKEFEDALSVVDSGKFEEDEKIKLLYYMEKGIVQFHKKDYYLAARTFSDANELVDKLYTKSVKEKIYSSLMNDNSKTYYGAIFERSLLYYYQALSFFELSKTEKYIDQAGNEIKLSSSDRKAYLMSSRSTLLAWDTFFTDLKRSTNYTSIQKMDLTSKSIAAKIHEQIGTRRDREIALQLYKDALDILLRYAPAYSVFNNEFIQYNKLLNNVLLNKMNGSKLKAQGLTPEFESYKNYLQRKILELSKVLRPTEYKKLRRKLGIKTIEPKYKKTELLIEFDYINRLQSKNFSFNLNTALENIEDPNTKALVEGIGVPVLTYFALGPLGLGYVTRTESVSIYSHHNLGTELTKELGVEFQLPYLEPPKPFEEYFIEIRNKKGELKETQKVTLINSFDDLAYINSQEMIEGSFAKRSLRVGLKYVAAIAAAYMTYKSMKNDKDDSLARAAALTQFLFSAKAISASEEADARHWSTLPAFIGQVEVDLPNGDYEVFISSGRYPSSEKGDEAELPGSNKLGNLKISDDSKTLFTYRNF